MAWDDIASDPEFQSQPPDVRRRVAANYFDRNLTDNDFYAQPTEVQQKARARFSHINGAGFSDQDATDLSARGTPQRVSARLKAGQPSGIEAMPDTGVMGQFRGGVASGFAGIANTAQDIGHGVGNLVNRAQSIGNGPELAPEDYVARDLAEYGQQQQEQSGANGLGGFVANQVGQAIPFMAGAAFTGGLLPEAQAGATAGTRLAYAAGRGALENAVPAAAMAPQGERLRAGLTAGALGVALSPLALLHNRGLPGQAPLESEPQPRPPFPASPRALLPAPEAGGVEYGQPAPQGALDWNPPAGSTGEPIDVEATPVPYARSRQISGPGPETEPTRRPAFSRRELPQPLETPLEEPSNGQAAPAGPDTAAGREDVPAQAKRNGGIGQAIEQGSDVQGGEEVIPPLIRQVPQRASAEPYAGPERRSAARLAQERATSPVQPSQPLEAAQWPSPVLDAVRSELSKAQAEGLAAPLDAAGMRVGASGQFTPDELIQADAELRQRVQAAKAAKDMPALKAAMADASLSQGIGRAIQFHGPEAAEASGRPYNPEELQSYADMAGIKLKGQTNESSEVSQAGPLYGNGEQSGGALEARGRGQEVAAGSGSQGIRPQAPAQAPKGTLNELPRPQGSTQREYKAWKSKLSPEDAARHTAWEKRLDAEIQAGAPERAARSAGLDAAVEKRRATWPGNKAMADKVQKQLADAGIQATRHEADTGSIYFDLPSGEKIRIADHAAPRGGGFSIEQQSRMGEAKYDLNAEGVREGMRGPIDLPPHDDQIAQAIRDESPGAQGEVGPAVGDHVQWTSLGVDQFETPKRIESIQEHEGKQYAMLEGEKGGVPLDQLSKQELPEPPTAPKTEVQPEGEPELTSLRKGDIDAARERIGLNRIDGLEKKSFAEADAKAKHSNLKGKAHEMAQEVLTGDKRLTMEETAGMAHRITEINNRRAFLQDRIDNKSTDPGQRTLDVGELEKGQQEADTIWQAVRQSGRSSGQENAIKAVAWDSEGNLTAQLAMAREAKGSDLTPKEIVGLKNLVAERDATIVAHEKEIERLKTEKASSVLQRKARSKVTRSAKSYEESFSKVRDLLRAGCGR